MSLLPNAETFSKLLTPSACKPLNQPDIKDHLSSHVRSWRPGTKWASATTAHLTTETFSIDLNPSPTPETVNLGSNLLLKLPRTQDGLVNSLPPTATSINHRLIMAMAENNPEPLFHRDLTARPIIARTEQMLFPSTPLGTLASTLLSIPILDLTQMLRKNDSTKHAKRGQ
jgi:hypothetical protein